MEQMVRFLASRLAQPVFIDILHDDRILMRLSDRKIFIFLIESLCSELRNIDPVSHFRRLDRLTAAVRTAEASGSG